MPRPGRRRLPLPAPAPAQRNAALAAPDDEPRGTLRRARPRCPPASPARLGTVGPLAWPTAYEDVIGFTLWPKEYGERLRVHGIGDVLSTAFAPSAAHCRQDAANVQQARADEPNSAPVAPTCGSVDLTSTDWPIAQITSTIELNDAQRAHARSAQDRVERCGLVDQVDLPQRRRISRRSSGSARCRIRFGRCTTRRNSSARRSRSSTTR